MTVSEQLRNELVRCGETHYRIGKETGISPSALDRFASGEYQTLRGQTVDKLCEFLGLELAKKKTGTMVKQAKKKTTTKRQRRKKSGE